MQREADGQPFVENMSTAFPLVASPELDRQAQQQDGPRGGLDWLPMLGITFLFFVVMLLAMSVGVLISNRRIKGSCGGLAALEQLNAKPGQKIACSLCSNPREECKELRKAMQRKQMSEQVEGG